MLVTFRARPDEEGPGANRPIGRPAGRPTDRPTGQVSSKKKYCAEDCKCDLKAASINKQRYGAKVNSRSNNANPNRVRNEGPSN